MVAVLNWALNHWWVFLWLSIFGVFGAVRNFFVDMAKAIGGAGERKHQRRIEEIRAATPPSMPVPPPPPAAPGKPKPGRCVHRNVVQVRTADGELVGWLCQKLGCEKRLPPDWAVAEEDLP